MIQTQTQFQSTQKVVERLQAEGWVKCPDLGFPALAQQLIANLRAFVLDQLRRHGGSLQLVDLQLAALIFSVPTHQYEVHPHLPGVLQQLEAEGEIVFGTLSKPAAQSSGAEITVALRTANIFRLG